MAKAKRRIKRARITHISLCKRGANRSAVIYKSVSEDRGMFDVEAVAKLDEEGLLTAVVVAPGVTFSDGDVVDQADVIKESCHGWLTECIANGGGVDVSHDFKTLAADAVQVCENFIIQKNDPRFADYQIDGEPRDATGGWGVVFKINDETIRARYRTGDWNGVSMAGDAIVEPITMQDFPDALAESLGQTQSELDMDETKLAELIAAQNAPVLGALEALTKALTPNTDTNDDSADTATEVKFEGDPSDLDAVRAHQRTLRVAKVDWNDPKSVADYEAELAKEAADSNDGDAGADLDADTQAQVDALEKQRTDLQTEVARLRGGSAQGSEGSRVQKSTSDADTIASARATAKSAAERFNKRRGL